MSILDRKVSFFKTTKHTQVLGNFPISQALEYIKGGKFREKIDKVREGQKLVKTQLPTVAMHGVFSNERKKDQFIEASGIIILENRYAPRRNMSVLAKTHRIIDNVHN